MDELVQLCYHGHLDASFVERSTRQDREAMCKSLEKIFKEEAKRNKQQFK
jgi:hypothetical protein